MDSGLSKLKPKGSQSFALQQPASFRLCLRVSRFPYKSSQPRQKGTHGIFWYGFLAAEVAFYLHEVLTLSVYIQA